MIAETTRARGTPWPRKHDIFGVRVSATDYDECARLVLDAARARNGGTVTHLAVHALMTAATDAPFRQQINEFDVVAPDGQPVRKAMNYFHESRLSDRVYGPELMARLCERAASDGTKVYLYGSTAEVVAKLADALKRRYPGLDVVGSEPSLFRPLTEEEDHQLVDRVNDSGAGLLFVGLGCPRQEVFAHEHRDRIKAVQLCVGAAFDFHAGNKRMAPTWMQRRGLEWFYRLTQEPGRLWRRYLVTNTQFSLFFARRMLLGR